MYIAMKKKAFVKKVLLDVAATLIIGIPLIVFVTVVEPYKRGFFCDDDSIRFSYKEDTITITTVAIIGTSLPSVVIVVMELVRHRKSSVSRLPFDIHPLLWTIYHQLSVFIFGCCMTMFTVEMAKVAVGRLRPHFISVCMPDKGQVCVGVDMLTTYIEQYNCIGGDTKKIKQARLSFPSGHAAFSVFTMCYLSMYLQSRWKDKWDSFLKPLMQFVAMAGALYTCLSRISDHKHHYSDVLGGAILGLSLAWLTGKFLSNLFQEREISYRIATPETQELKISSAV